MPEIPQFTPRVDVSITPVRAAPHLGALALPGEAEARQGQQEQALGARMETFGDQLGQLQQLRDHNFLLEQRAETAARWPEEWQRRSEEAAQTGQYQGAAQQFAKDFDEDLQTRLAKAPSNHAREQLTLHGTTLRNSLIGRAANFEHKMAGEQARASVGQTADAYASQVFRDPTQADARYSEAIGHLRGSQSLGLYDPIAAAAAEKAIGKSIYSAHILGRAEAGDTGVLADLKGGKFDSYLDVPTRMQLEPHIQAGLVKRLSREIPYDRFLGGGGGAPGGGGRGIGAWGPHGDTVVATMRAAGASDAFVQAAVANGLAEGGFAVPWGQSWIGKDGKREESYGPWQYHRGGELEGYLEKEGRDNPQDIVAQTRFLLRRMEELVPGITKTADPRAATDAIATKFERYEGAAPGQRYSHLGRAQQLLAGGGSGGGAASGGIAAEGVIEPGTIDLAKRPVVHNADGSISTVRSITIGEDGYTTVIPTVAADGSRILSNEEAIAQYRASRQHLGKFETEAQASRYAEALHNAQARQYGAPAAAAAPAAAPAAPAAAGPGSAGGLPALMAHIDGLGLDPDSTGRLKDTAIRHFNVLEAAEQRQRRLGEQRESDENKAREREVIADIRGPTPKLTAADISRDSRLSPTGQLRMLSELDQRDQHRRAEDARGKAEISSAREKEVMADLNSPTPTLDGPQITADPKLTTEAVHRLLPMVRRAGQVDPGVAQQTAAQLLRGINDGSVINHAPIDAAYGKTLDDQHYGFLIQQVDRKRAATEAQALRPLIDQAFAAGTDGGGIVGLYRHIDEMGLEPAVAASLKTEAHARYEALEVEQGRRQRLAVQNRTAASDAREDAIIADARSPAPKITAMEVESDPALTREARARVRAALDHTGIVAPGVSSKATNQLLSQIEAGQIGGHAAINAQIPNLTKSDYDFLIRRVDDVRTADGEKLRSAENEFFHLVEPKIDKSKLLGIQDEPGAEQFLQFKRDYYRRKDEMLSSSPRQDPGRLSDPGAPEYLGKPEIVQPYIDRSKRGADAAKAAAGGPAPAAIQYLRAHPDPVTRAQFDQRYKKPGLADSILGAPAPAGVPAPAAAPTAPMAR